MLAGGDRVGSRRVLSSADVGLLESVSDRYARAVQAGADDAVFVGLGWELFGWLEGGAGQLSGLLERAGSPVVFEVQGPRTPAAGAWAVLRAPWEVLARPGGGFLAGDGLARFSVIRRLGPPVAAPPLDGFRLGLAFMASSPQGLRPELDFEAEEAAILAAVGDTRMDLLVDDTGDPQQLGNRLADAGGVPVVHLSCHGLNRWPPHGGESAAPVLLAEDELGGVRPTTAADLVRLLPTPRLMFVSACLTATGPDATAVLPPGARHKGDSGGGAAHPGDQALVAHSLATALVTAGVPAVIGWDGSVDDQAATIFAGHLYQGLANRKDVHVAVGDARRMLLASTNRYVRADWHLARVWLGPTGGGPVVAGTRQRSLVAADRGTRAFLGRGHQVPVAAAEMFVGRRAELQQALRVLRSDRSAGVLLHGQGRLGKSSLAARLVDRLADRSVAVVFGEYTALAVLDAVAEAVRANPPARDLIEQRLAQVRQRPEALEAVLIDLLTGPCAQPGDRRQPLLLVIDDLEQILMFDPAGPHRVLPAYAPVLAAVLRAFHPTETTSRLLVTSRYTFTLDGLEKSLTPVHLRPFSPVAQHKLHRRHQASTPLDRQVERAGLGARSVAVSRGNPGLQDLIGLRLVYAPDVPLDRAAAVLTEMETYLRHGDLPADHEVRQFLEDLALDALIQQAGPANLALLRATTVFELPVPQPVIQLLADHVGGSASRLQGFGLLDSYPDPYHPGRPALAVNPLAAGRVDAVTSTERAAVAALVAGPLLAAWGGPTRQPGRSTELDWQLTRLGLDGDNPSVVAASAAGAVRQLRTGHATDAARLGQAAIDLLDRHTHPVPINLLRAAADAAFTAGDGGVGDELLGRAVRQATADDTAAGNRLDHARVLSERARRLLTTGQPDLAAELLQQAHQLFTTAGSEREAAVVTGYLADIHFRRGDYDETLRIRREVQLPVYERLGDLDGIAAATWGLAQIDLARQDDQSAAPRLMKSFQLLYQLQRADGVAIVGFTLGQLMLAAGETEQAHQVLTAALTAATKIGHEQLAGHINELLNQPHEGTAGP